MPLPARPLNPPERLFSSYNEAVEYVASFSYGSYSFGGGEWLRELPSSFDDITEGLREDIYEQMLLDAQVRANLNLYVHGIVGGGLQFIPASDSPRDREVTEFIERCATEYLETDLLTSVLPDMLRAIVLGYRIAEKVTYAPENSPERGKTVYQRIKPKDRRSVHFIVDAQMNVAGIVGYVNPTEEQRITQYPGVRTYLDRYYGGSRIVFPRDRFMVFSWKPTNGDPRGNSESRSAYDAWWFKQQLKPEYLKYLATYAMGFMYGTLPENASRSRAKINPDGSPALDTDGTTPVVRSEANDMLSVLENIQNGSVGVFPFGTKVDSIQNTSDGRPFIMALDFYNKEITKAMTGQVFATESSSSASGSAANVHENILDMPLTYGTLAAEAMLQRDFVNPLVRMNYSRLVRPPKVRLPGMNLKDMLQLASAVSKLSLATMLSPDQFPEIYNMLGLKQPNEAGMKKLAEEYWKQKEAKSNSAGGRLASDGQNITDKPQTNKPTGAA